MRDNSKISLSIVFVSVLSSLIAAVIWNFFNSFIEILVTETNPLFQWLLVATVGLVVVVAVADYFVIDWLMKLVRRKNGSKEEDFEKQVMDRLKEVVDEQKRTNKYLEDLKSAKSQKPEEKK